MLDRRLFSDAVTTGEALQLRVIMFGELKGIGKDPGLF